MYALSILHLAMIIVSIIDSSIFQDSIIVNLSVVVSACPSASDY